MIPTDRAKALYGQIAQAVDRLEKVNGEFRLSKHKPILRIGGPSEYLHECVIPRLPDSPYDITFTFGETKPLLQALKESNLDLLIATQHVATSGIVFTHLAKEKFLLVGNRPLEELTDVTDSDIVRRELEQANWISYSAEIPIIRRFWFEAFGARNALTPCLVAPDLRVIRTMVKQGLGISVLPDYLVQADLQTEALHELWQPPVPVVNDLWVAYRSSDRTDDTFMHFVEDMVGGSQ